MRWGAGGWAQWVERHRRTACTAASQLRGVSRRAGERIGVDEKEQRRQQKSNSGRGTAKHAQRRKKTGLHTEQCTPLPPQHKATPETVASARARPPAHCENKPVEGGGHHEYGARTGGALGELAPLSARSPRRHRNRPRRAEARASKSARPTVRPRRRRRRNQAPLTHP